MLEDQPKLRADQVLYLAIEGGGGAGNALPGAIEALEELGVLQFSDFRSSRILGFAGASAGAINSLFLSCGFDSEEIGIILGNQDFNDFFDTPAAGTVPRVGGCGPSLVAPVATEADDLLIEMMQTLIQLMAETNPLVFLSVGPVQVAKTLQKLASLSANAADRFTMLNAASLLFYLVTFFGEDLPDSARQKLSSNPLEVAKSIRYDYGIFPGCVIREFFDKWIAIGRYRRKNSAKLPRPNGRAEKEALLDWLVNEYAKQRLNDFKNARFEDHESEFQVKLAVTGTNLSTYKSHIFSNATTPRMLVADAVRISMSLPIIFKPLILPADSVDLQRVIGEDESVSSVSPDTGDTEPHYLAGVWVDGGLCNNLPLGVFDSEPQENPKTLGLRLNLEVRAEIATIFDYLKVWPLGMVFGTGESHISQTTGNWHQTIILDPLGLGLLDFSPETSDLEAAQDKAWESTFSYFGSAAPPR